MAFPAPRECPPDRRARVVVVEISNKNPGVPPVGTEYVLDRSPFFFGLTRSCMPDPRDIAVRAHGMSRGHAYFELRDGGWWVHDNSSTNGTWVDGKPVRSSRVVDGNRVTLGAHGADPPVDSGVTFEFHEP
jgi:hypothetical protein